MTWILKSSFFTVALLLTVSVTLIYGFKLHEREQTHLHLAHECVNPRSAGSKTPPVIMLHGLTDRKETWQGIYQDIALLAARRVCIYDARNHGDSSWNDAFSLDVLTEDLNQFMHDMKIEKASLVGHSMGGLTAMKFALKYPTKVEKLFIEDISPVRIPEEAATSVSKTLLLFLSSLSAIPKGADELTAKNAVANYIQKVSKDITPEHLFKRYTLQLRDGVWQWKANFAALVRALADADSFLGKMEGHYEQNAVFIYGTASSFKVGDQKEAIMKLFPKAKFVSVEGAGHGIHSNHPEFLRELIHFLN